MYAAGARLFKCNIVSFFVELGTRCNNCKRAINCPFASLALAASYRIRGFFVYAITGTEGSHSLEMIRIFVTLPQ
jgi:predicted membrane-bound dolichyl-phosphate-mannose-protein mannosyltransferase